MFVYVTPYVCDLSDIFSEPKNGSCLIWFNFGTVENDKSLAVFAGFKMHWGFFFLRIENTLSWTVL